MSKEEAIAELMDYADNSWGELNESFRIAIECIQRCIDEDNNETIKEEFRKWHCDTKLRMCEYANPNGSCVVAGCVKGLSDSNN